MKSSILIPSNSTTLSKVDHDSLLAFEHDPSLSSLIVKKDSFIIFYEKLSINDDELINGSSKGLFYKIIFNQDELKYLSYNSFYPILFTLIFFLIVLPLLIAQKLKKYLFIRIDKINDRLNTLSSDLHIPPLSIEYNDEIGTIINHINNLHQRIKNAEQKLRATVDDMEQRVFRRTVQVGEETKERKKAQEEVERQRAQLLVSDKLKTLGTLAAGVAHEINNPNNFIQLNVPLIKQIVFAILSDLENNQIFHKNNREIAGLEVDELKETLEKLLQGIESGSTRISKIVDSLKRYSKPETNEKVHKPFNLNALIKNSLPLINGLIKKSTDNFITNLDETLLSPIGDNSQIEQVIINIIQNSCQALPNKECFIVVKTYNLPEEKAVVFEVKDQGIGIDPSILDKIQDPFFTTKRDNGGTGLGLSISTKIIKEHNGQLLFESEVGVGTVTKLILPIENNEGDYTNE
ncbi:MAG: ATP-binding protein, partial [Lentisphaeria bacterium]